MRIKDLPIINSPKAFERLHQELKELKGKIIVLDDDPTGVQTVHDIYVYTNWKEDTIREAFQDGNTMSFILTNSRSFSEDETRRVHREIGKRIQKISKELGISYVLISRGDSTLRGHYPLETNTLKEAILEVGGDDFDGEIILPFFPEGGRYTIGNTHYVKENEELVPVGETEFSKDSTFSFQSSDLSAFVEEKSRGEYKKEDCITISLEDLRESTPTDLAERIMSATSFTKIIVNAVCYTDVALFCNAWVIAMKQGKNYMVRSAAALPKVIGEIEDIPLLDHDLLCSGDQQHGGLIIIGSHVKKTTEQLTYLMNSTLPIHFEEFSITGNETVSLSNLREILEKEADRIKTIVEDRIQNGRTVAIYTSRELFGIDFTDKEQMLQISVQISEALTGIVARLSVPPKYLIAKGGITSSDVGTKGLSVRRALVLGQVQPGVPVWKTGEESHFSNLPYIIFPGNVGNKETLYEVVKVLEA